MMETLFNMNSNNRKRLHGDSDDAVSESTENPKKEKLIANKNVLNLAGYLLNDLYDRILLHLIDGIFDNSKLHQWIKGLFDVWNRQTLVAGPIKILFSDAIEQTKFFEYFGELVKLLETNFKGTIAYNIRKNANENPEGTIGLDSELIVNDESIPIRIDVNVGIYTSLDAQLLDKMGINNLIRSGYVATVDPTARTMNED